MVLSPSSQQNAKRVLILDDSEVFRLLVSGNLINKGFQQSSKDVFTRGSTIVHFVSGFEDAMVLINKDSPQHIDFCALFVDWHLSPKDRASHHDGVQIAVAACDHENQPFDPMIYCISGDGPEMRKKIYEKVQVFGAHLGNGSTSLETRLVIVDYLAVVDMIARIAGPEDEDSAVLATPDVSSLPFPDRLQALRDEIKKLGLDGFLIPMADEFQSETPPPSAQRIAFLTGFTGSAGLIALLDTKAAFFTDGRYTLQAQQQLPKRLFSIIDSGQVSVSDWLQDNVLPKQKIGFDPWLHTASAIRKIKKAFDKSGAMLVPVTGNPIDALWRERPASPAAPIYAHDVLYAGQASADKRRLLANALKKDGLDAAVITDPASVAWLLNVRGGDIPFSPLPLSYVILRDDASVEWFVDPRKITSGLDTYAGIGVTRYNVSEFPAALKRLGEMKCSVRVDYDEAPFSVTSLLNESGARIDRGPDPCAVPKACKNMTELEGMRACHRRDGAAMARFLCWLEQAVPAGGITELSAEEKLLEFRSGNHLFRGPSFATIAASGAHGAIVHYRATQVTNQDIKPDMLFLIDSGGQYSDGTTDVTRTVAIGQPLLEMKDRFTRVLKGHIALASIIFPEGTTGADLDVLARQHLWALGLDYNHGTGHGVGSYLSVHEGPPSISRRGSAPLKAGMVLSNEPGFYQPGHYGIRLENLQAVVERIDLSGTERKMFSFEPLTLVPIDKRLIVVDLLTEGEIEWLNDYHARVHQAIRPLVDEATAKWLEEATGAV